MSRNPYEQQYEQGRNPQRPATPYGADPGYGPEGAVYAQPPRTSVMALLSLFCSIPCCFVPLFPPLGVILGAVSLSLIGSSRGRLAGRGFAIAGIILGILFTTLWVAMGFGVTQGYAFYEKQMAPPVSAVMQAASAGRFGEARAALGATAQAEVSDERMAAFAGAIELEHGEVAGASGKFGTLFESFQRMRQERFEFPDAGSVQGVPIGLDTANGPVLAYAFFDKGALDAQSVEVMDLMVFLDSDRVVTLREAGPAASFAASMGLEVVDLSAGGVPPPPPEAPDAPAEPAAGEAGAEKPGAAPRRF